MNPVILISSCHSDLYKGYHNAILETWGKDPAIPFFFLLGAAVTGPVTEKDGVVRLPVPDDYNSLPMKTLEGHRWAVKQGYDYIFQGFTDTYCFTKRMLNSDFGRYDYVGHFRGEDTVPQSGKVNLGCYASGGSGYWLSPYATEKLLEEKPDHWAEDLWVGRVMKKHGILGTQDYRYHSAGGYVEGCLTVHLSRGTNKYNPADMFETHRTAKVRGEL